MTMIPEDKPIDWRESAAPPPAGDNRPPSMVELAIDDMREALKPFEQRRDEFVASAAKQVVKDRHDVGAAGDTIKLSYRVWDLIEAERTKRSMPHRDAQLAIKGEADDFWSPVVEAMQSLRDQIKAFNDAENERIEAQRREQAEAMQAMRAKASAPAMPAPTAPAAPRRVRGKLGATVSTTEEKIYVVTDVRAVPDFILNSDTVKAAIATVARQMAKHMSEIPGITISTQDKTRIS